MKGTNRTGRKPAVLHYAAAIALVGLATAARFPLQGALGADVPFLLYFPALLAAAWFGGFGPGLVASLLSAFAAAFFWMRPEGGAVSLTAGHALQLFLFLAISTFMCWLVERLHGSIRRLDHAHGRIEQILATMTDGFAILDRDWRYVYVNVRGAEIARHPAHELLGKKLWDLFPEEVGGASYRQLQKAMQQNVPVHYETFYEKFGRWFEVRGYPAEEGLALYVADITEKKHIELAVKHELEGQVAEKTRELAQRNEALEALTHTLAHDLRAPLRAISGFSKILLEDYAKRLDEEGQDFCRRIAEAGHHAEKMMADLLEFARLSHAPLPKERLVLDRLVTRVLERLAEDIQKTGANVAVRRPLPDVFGNETVLEQALTNLITNALKFRRDEVSPRVTIGAEKLDGKVTLSVVDNGIGIAPEHVARLFRPFQRLTTQRSGSGLGLSIVKKGVERMGGRVGMDSKAGEGSRFWIMIPAAEALGVN
jgi:PAS domain S-box-containing protein